MPAPPAAVARVTSHPGSSARAIAEEPRWGRGHQHRTGFVNASGRRAGLTHGGGDEDVDADREEEKREESEEGKVQEAKAKEGKGGLMGFDDVWWGDVDHEKHEKGVYPRGWRKVVKRTEEDVKYGQEWPANIKRREREEEQKKEKQEKDRANGQDEPQDGKQEGSEDASQKQQNGDSTQKEESQDPEHDWRRAAGHNEGKHHGAYPKKNAPPSSDTQRNGDDQGQHSNGTSQDGTGQSNGDANGSTTSSTNTEDTALTEHQRLLKKYTPQELTLLSHLQHESHVTQTLTQNPGNLSSPFAPKPNTKLDPTTLAIDATDAMTPDNWIPRLRTLIRRTGQHPMNAEPKLADLHDAGMITPNRMHYVRNHGAVPKLSWEEHVLEVSVGEGERWVDVGMEELRSRWESINVPVLLACDGNRRGEMNLIRKSKGFDWGAGAVGCAYWKGVRVGDVLRELGLVDGGSGERRWVHFEGADEPSEGRYATSIPLEYCLDMCNDVMLAYEMNDAPLPPDHGYPVRLLVPGYVGGRSVKWLRRMWVTGKENDSHYHIWDNRVLPSFVTEKDGEFARTMFHHPSTACMEQNLNSVIVKPAQGEKLDLLEVLKKDTFRVEGYAYDGGGHEVQRVELSLDNGETWLYCLRRFPDRPLRHGNKFWTWVHWHIDLDAAYFVRAESLVVRCFNVFKNTQPEKPSWNLMGMMNNGWYRVTSETDKDGKLLFRHPYDQEGTEGGGWMKPSVENQLAAAKQDSGVPDKQFTREEIEKHNTKDDCWLVINNNVYDATSVLSWHPGGTAALLANAGKLSQEVTSSFENVHDEYAHKKLAECAIGKVTDKAKNFILEQVKAEAERAAKGGDNDVVLNSKRWTLVTLTKKKQISKDTFTYTFTYQQEGEQRKKLGLGTCQHIQFGVHMLDKMLIRSYTPTRPIEEDEEDGTFELTVKTYFPDDNQPGGAFSTFLHEMEVGEQVDVCGPTGEITYLGNGKFNIEGDEQTYKKVSLVLGGSGLTPGYALIKRVVEDSGDETEIAVVDANKTEDDILLRESLNELVEKSKGKLKIAHVLSHPKDKDGWEKQGGLSGHVNEDIIKEKLFEPSEESVVFLCGPPGMIQKAALPALKGWGYEEDKNCFGF